MFLNLGKSSGIISSMLSPPSPALAGARSRRVLDILTPMYSRIFCIFISLLHSSNSLIFSVVSHLLFQPFLVSVTIHLLFLKIHCLFFFSLHNMETLFFLLLRYNCDIKLNHLLYCYLKISFKNFSFSYICEVMPLGIIIISTLIFFFFFWPHCTACGILISRPGIEPAPPALEAQSLNHWTAREDPMLNFFTFFKNKSRTVCWVSRVSIPS